MDISFVLRKFKKSIAGFTLLALLASFVSFAGIASAFTDTSGHWAEDYIDELVSQGVVSGYDANTFGPDDSLTRAQLAKIAVLAFLGEDAVESGDAVFSDVPSSHWAFDYIGTAYTYGIVNGYTDADGELTGYYGPEDTVTRDAAAKILVGAAGLTSYSPSDPTFSDVPKTAWSYEYVETAYHYSVLDGYGNGKYGPADAVTRGQISKMTVNAQNPVERTTDEGGEDTDTVTGEGATLLVELSDDTPAGDTMPDGATSVPLVTWDFTAEGDDLELDMVEIHQYAIATLDTTHNMYLYEGTARLTSGVAINSTTGLAKFNNLNLEIEEGETRSLTVRMDEGTTDATTTREVGLELVDADALDAGEADVEGDFPLQGDKFSIASENAGTLTVAKSGTITNPKVGEDDVTISKFTLAASGEGADLAELGLYLTGTVTSSDVENFELYVSGEDDALATVEAVDGSDVIRFVLDDVYTIAKGDSKTLYVTADFNTGRTSDSVKVYVDESTDVVAYGDKYGYGLTLTKTLYDGNADACLNSSSNDCSYSTLEGGDITVSSSGPAAGDIGIDADDAVLMNFTITSVTNATFKNFGISLDTPADTDDATEGLLNSTASNFTDIKITDVDSGTEIWTAVDADVFTTALGGTTAIAETTTQDTVQAYHLYTDDLAMESGEELNLALSVDVANTTTLDGMTLVATLELGTSYPELRDANNKVLTNSSTLVPYSAITAKTMTVQSPSLTMSLASTPSSRTYVKGTHDVQFTGLVFACGTATDCVVTDVTLTGYLHETGGTPTSALATAMQTYVNQVWFEDADGNMVGSPAGVTSTGTAVFDNEIDWTIGAGETETLYVVGDLTSNCYGSSNAESIGFGVAAASNVTVTDDDGNSITPTGTPNSTPTYYATTASGGPITFTVASDTHREDIIVAGATGVEISKFKVSTEGASATDATEDFTIKSISVRNRQTAAGTSLTDANLGAYDDNIVGVKIEYTDSTGSTVQKTGSLVNGTAAFSGMDMFIEGDTYEYITVYADLNTIAGGADAATYVDFALAFDNFEALAASSGETYKADKIDATVAAASDLDFGTITWVDSTADVDGAPSAIALGATTNLTYDDGADGDSGLTFPVGTLLCTDTGATACSADEIYVVTGAQTDNGADDTQQVRLVDNNAADVTSTAAAADNDNVLYALPGVGYFSTTKHMYVYESLPTITLSTSSPSAGSRNVSSTDEVFVFDVTASTRGKVQFRAGTEVTGVILDGLGTPCAISTVTTAGLQVDGSSQLCTLDSTTAGDSFSWDVTGTDMSGYARVNFWIRWDDQAGGADADFADFKVGTGLLQATFQQTTTLSATACGTNATDGKLVDDEWYNCDVAMPTGTDSSDLFFHIEIDEATEIADTDLIYVDELWFYNEKITVDISADTEDLDDYTANSTNIGGPVEAYLKSGSTTYSTAYIQTNTNGASDGQTATITFIPSTEILVEAGGTTSLKVVTDTIDLLADESGVDDPVTFKIDYGSATDTTVTAGDVYWYETNATVTWLGNQANTSLTSNTVKY